MGWWMVHVQSLLLVSLELLAVAALVALAPTIAVPRRRWALMAGAAVLVAATSPPVHSAADRSVSAHMVQHLLVVLVAAPLVAWGLAGSSLGTRRLTRRIMTLTVRSPWSPLVAAAVHVAVMAAWHVPALYDGAVDAGWLHAIEHVTLLASACWWWLALGHHATRSHPLAAAASLFLSATGWAVLGVALMFAGSPLYASQRGVADLQTAGALLAASGVVYSGVAAALMARVVARLDRPRPHRMPASTARITGVSVLIAGGVVALATQLQRPAEVTAASAQGLDVGRALYRRDCAQCHGAAGEGTHRGIPISDLGTASVYYVLSTGRMPIVEPTDRIEHREPRYTPDQIDSLVAYTATFVDGPPLPELTDRESLATGGELYRLHCAACHGATAIGGAQAFGREAPTLQHNEPLEIAAAIVAGPAGMPSFVGALTDAEVAAVADYVEHLQDPVTRGIPIPGDRIGEGFVAWLVGVGSLVAFASWLARTRT